jgi:hypothetical protein
MCEAQSGYPILVGVQEMAWHHQPFRELWMAMTTSPKGPIHTTPYIFPLTTVLGGAARVFPAWRELLMNDLNKWNSSSPHLQSEYCIFSPIC